MLKINSIAFILAVVIGSAWIWRMSTVSDSMLIIAGPIIVMMVYAIYIVRSDLTDEKSGDTLYFLGFVYTLIALIVALGGPLTDGADADVDRVIGSFGIALTTTIIGLIGRVLLLSQYSHHVDSDSEASFEIIARFRNEVNETIRLMEQMRAELKARLEGTKSSEIDSIREVTAEAKTNLASVAKSAISEVEKHVVSSGENLSNSLVQFEGASRACADIIESTGSALALAAEIQRENHRQIIDGAENTRGSLERARDAHVTVNEEILTEAANTKIALSELRDAVHDASSSIEMGELNASLVKFNEVIEKQHEPIGKINAELTHVESNLREIVRGLGVLTKTFEASVRHVEGEQQDFERMGKKVRVVRKEMTEDLEMSARILVQAASTTTKVLEKLRNQI
jgi:hypothetical protein